MIKPNPLSVRPKVAVPMQVSKWLACPMLIDVHEMENLLQTISPIEIFAASGLMPQGEGLISHEEFLDCYRQYIDTLRQGLLPSDNRMLRYFSAVLTRTREALYAVYVDESRQLIKVEQPVVQLQTHRIALGADKKFRSMVMGPDSIYWGIQFSYPQLYQNAEMQVVTIRDNDDFLNSKLFKLIQRWMRDHTVATPFMVEGRRLNVSFRLGKACFGWINEHPQLKEAGISVVLGKDQLPHV